VGRRGVRSQAAIEVRSAFGYPPRVTRIAIELIARQLNAAYLDDPFHALRKNLASVGPAEWDVRPSGWTTEEFGTRPELSIRDLALHVGGAMYMYAERAFGAATMEWGDIALPERDMDAVLAWMDEGHRALAEGLDSLEDDEDLAVERPAPWRVPMARGQLLSIVINHDLYHSGEINRQRALIRGTTGWDRS
jgi:hypothetical protein